MIFEEEKAAEIIKKYGLNETTLKVWKSRGKIPERYLKEGFELKDKAQGERDDQVFRDIKRIFDYGKINVMSVSRLLEIKESRMRDILYNDIMPTKDELLAIKKAIKMLRIEAIEIMSLMNRLRVSEEAIKKLKGFLSRQEIKCILLFENRKTGKTMLDWQNGRRKSYPAEYKNEVLQALGVFITETTMM